MAGRPPTYQSEDARPVSVSLRVPRTLYEQAHQRVQMRRMTLTEALLEGLQLWLETPADPREVFLSDESNTVMQQLQAMVTAAVQAELAKLQGTAPYPATTNIHPTTTDILSDDGNTVLQENTFNKVAQYQQLSQATLDGAREIITDTIEQTALSPAVQGQRIPQVRAHAVPAPRGLPRATLEAIVEARRQEPGLTIRDFAQRLYDTGIYRAKGDKPAEAGWLHRQLVKAREAGLL
jgi:hypothetical protein